MVEIPETLYSVLLIKDNEIMDKELFHFQFDALQYINELGTKKYIFIGWIDVKKGSKLIWIIEHNLETGESDAKLLEKVNGFLFNFDDDWANEWA
tara:strand:+ start:410 stop:694 length:285 start_codon:yes stop_codon:yes gene_type:complete